MSKSKQDRLASLEAKSANNALTKAEHDRLINLQGLLDKQKRERRPCPFRTDTAHPTCTKPGGVCSIRAYRQVADTIEPVEGEKGAIRVLCPWRFHQKGTVFDSIGQRIFGDPKPTRAGEVGFLESSGSLESSAGKDVGRIDMVLLKSNAAADLPLDWVAVEIQAVYFSGKEMEIEFAHIQASGGSLSMAQAVRRPDYRSSGVKRLMPQLLIKVPTLSRWGKKTAVVVDKSFFYAMGKMKRVSDISNADIVWFLIDFVEDAGEGLYQLEVADEVYTTLGEAAEGLTGGRPVSKEAFESRIRQKASILALR